METVEKKFYQTILLVSAKRCGCNKYKEWYHFIDVNKMVIKMEKAGLMDICKAIFETHPH